MELNPNKLDTYKYRGEFKVLKSSNPPKDKDFAYYDGVYKIFVYDNCFLKFPHEPVEFLKV